MPTRRLMTKSLYNARDLGGFPTKDGKTTRFGVFVRSEAPVDLPQEDIDYLKSYGVTASLDFRGTGESDARPSDLRDIMPYYHRPLFNEAAMSGGHPRPMKKIGWGEQYISMAEESRAWALDVLTLAANNPGATLYHCTTGKDRTGLMTCYLLSIAGVGREDIAADYCVSQIFLEPVYDKMRSGMMRLGPAPDRDGREGPGGPGGHEGPNGPGGQEGPDGPGGPGGPGGPMMDDSFFQTPATAMLSLFDYLTETYGGVVEYLRTIGLGEETIEKIRRKLVEA